MDSPIGFHRSPLRCGRAFTVEDDHGGCAIGELTVLEQEPGDVDGGPLRITVQVTSNGRVFLSDGQAGD